VSRPIRPRALAALTALAALSCAPRLGEAPEGLVVGQETAGPRVVFDLDARPLPEIPFPNDLATRPDATSPTGRRLNLSLLGPTLLESTVRAKADRLDGFGTFSPITVRFDAPVDVEDVRTRHRNRRGCDHRHPPGAPRRLPPRSHRGTRRGRCGRRLRR
jgi:hypothetical protein